MLQQFEPARRSTVTKRKGFFLFFWAIFSICTFTHLKALLLTLSHWRRNGLHCLSINNTSARNVSMNIQKSLETDFVCVSCSSVPQLLTWTSERRCMGTNSNHKRSSNYGRAFSQNKRFKPLFKPLSINQSKTFYVISFIQTCILFFLRLKLQVHWADFNNCAKAHKSLARYVM